MSVSEQGSVATPGDWYVPDYIHLLLHDGGMVYLDSQVGEWGARNRVAGAALLEVTGLIDEVGDLGWPELEEEWRPATQEVLDALVQSRLITSGTNENAPYTRAITWDDSDLLEAGNVVMTRLPAQPRELSPIVENLAHLCLGEAISLAAGPLSQLIKSVHNVRDTTSIPTIEQGEELAKIIYQIEDRYPGRVACLERSTATVLLGSRMGLHVDLRLGAAVDPIAFHAWPEVGGQPVRIEGEEPIVGRYHPMFTV